MIGEKQSTWVVWVVWLPDSCIFSMWSLHAQLGFLSVWQLQDNRTLATVTHWLKCYSSQSRSLFTFSDSALKVMHHHLTTFCLLQDSEGEELDSTSCQGFTRRALGISSDRGEVSSQKRIQNGNIVAVTCGKYCLLYIHDIFFK